MEETERLKTLFDYSVLDTTAEEQLDGLSELTASLLDVPIVLISLHGEDRQWFKSGFGITSTDIPEKIELCNHVLRGEDVFEVEDSLSDTQFAKLPEVTNSLKTRFFAGAPLMSANNKKLGVVSIIDHEPRKLDEDQKKNLKSIAKQVVSHLELRKNILTQKKLFGEQQGLIEQINAKNSNLKQFAYRTSHDLRAPVVRIQKLADYCIEDIEMGKEGEVKGNCQKIISNCIQMDELVSNINEYTRAELDSEEVIRIAFGDLERWILEEISRRFKNTKVKVGVKITVGETFYSERRRLYSLIFNLLANGIKFADPDKENSFVFLTIKLDQRKNLDIQIKDNGVGIDEEQHEDVFKMFKKLHPTKIDGSGLGMSIVKKHLNALKGKIKINSSKEGTVVSVSIPNSPLISKERTPLRNY